MRKLLFVLALFSGPVYAQQSQLTPQQLELQRMMIENQKKIDNFDYPDNEKIKKSVEAYLKAADEHAKALAACKTCVKQPTYRVEGTIVVQVRVDDGRYRPVCPYNNCR
jgi:hypothetical protein